MSIIAKLSALLDDNIHMFNGCLIFGTSLRGLYGGANLTPFDFIYVIPPSEVACNFICSACNAPKIRLFNGVILKFKSINVKVILPTYKLNPLDRNTIYLYNYTLFRSPDVDVSYDVANVSPALSNFFDNSNIHENLPAIVKCIIGDDYTKFKELTSAKMDELNKGIISRTAIFLDKYKYVADPTSRELLYFAILHNKLGFIKGLTDMDTCDVNGLTPMEFALNLYAENQTKYRHLVALLATYKYTRNPKWWDYILHTNIYDHETNVPFDKYVYSSMKTANVRTIAELNTFLLTAIFDYGGCAEQYVMKYANHIDVDHLLSNIKNNTISIAQLIEYVPKFLPVTANMVGIMLNQKMYEKINLHFYENIDANELLLLIMNELNFRGIIYIFEYIDPSLSSRKFTGGQSMLHILCTSQYLDNDDAMHNAYDIHMMVKVILHYNPQLINSVDDNGNTPIFLACNKPTLMEILITLGAKIDIVNKMGYTCLHHAIEHGNIACLHKLFNYGATDIMNTKNDNGRTPLLLAGFLRKKEFIIALMSYGAQTECIDDDNNSILHYICMHGLDVNISGLNIATKNKSGKMPFDCAIDNILLTV